MPTASYSGISSNEYNLAESGFTGSSSLSWGVDPSFVNYNPMGRVILPRVHRKAKAKTKVKKKSEVAEKKVRLNWRLNKSKFSKKMRAFSQLSASKKFMAFYSISFPMHIPDKVAMKCLNIWLTRIRKSYPEFKYIWVAERQKKNEENQTIHFHLVTSQFMNVKVVNWWMAKAIDGVVKEGLAGWGASNAGRYNGVDVRSIYNKAGVEMYLNKYCSKNEDAFDVRPWGCCRLVSALFTSVHVSIEWFKEMRSRGWIQDEIRGVKRKVEGVGWSWWPWGVEKSGVSKKSGKMWYSSVCPRSVENRLSEVNEKVLEWWGWVLYGESRAQRIENECSARDITVVVPC